jgi:hypothetical protein
MLGGQVQVFFGQVAHHGAAAAIRHVDHLDPGHDLEELAGHMAGSSNAGASRN